jgi:hypothetical protein
VVHQVLAALTTAYSFNIPVAAIVLSAAEEMDPHPSHQVLLEEFLKNRCVHSMTGGAIDIEPILMPLKPMPESWKSIPLLTLRHNQATFEEDIDWASLFSPMRFGRA